MLSFQQIANQLAKFQIHSNQIVSKQQIKKSLDKLLGQHFDQLMFQQIWDHAKQSDKNNQSSQNIQVKKFIKCILQAQSSLIQNIRISNQKIIEWTTKKQSLHGTSNIKKIQACQQIIEDQSRNKYENQADLNQLRKTFKVKLFQNKLQQNSDFQSNIIGVSSHQFQISWDLKFVFFSSLICLIFLLIMTIVKTDFHNLIYFILILSIFFLNFYDRYYIRLMFYMGLISLFLDILWLIINSASYWNVKEIDVLIKSQSIFYKYCVIMTSIIMIVKIGIEVVLFMYRDIINSDKYVLQIFREIRIQLGGKYEYCTISNQIVKDLHLQKQ